MTIENQNIVLGALDSLGTALSTHGHEWTEGERTIYEQATALLQAGQDMSGSSDEDEDFVNHCKACECGVCGSNTQPCQCRVCFAYRNYCKSVPTDPERLICTYCADDREDAFICTHKPKSGHCCLCGVKVLTDRVYFGALKSYERDFIEMDDAWINSGQYCAQDVYDLRDALQHERRLLQIYGWRENETLQMFLHRITSK